MAFPDITAEGHVTKEAAAFYELRAKGGAAAVTLSECIVHIKTGIVWADILIESSGGSDPLASHGHTKADARRIRELIEMAQANPAGKADG